ncbi:hypothetical protein ACP93_02450 [Xanthomonas sp. NCPPB 1128]|nr:hypothetical protein ACP93_02185 [Xanthomonas sp. NCPPB 1128]KMM77089.1 hypothetical protein ACP93_02450 [Xanthomonas sp. NCPPB 1128]
MRSGTCAVADGSSAQLRILSLGAGVQSTTIALMMAHAEIAPSDRAIFADTHAEPAAVYRHLEWLLPRLPFPTDVVSAGDLGAEILAASSGEARNDARPPFYVKNPDGSRGILRRQCTGDYKIDVIRKRVRELLGVDRGHRVPAGRMVTQVIGISLDEAGRMKVSRDKWQANEYPLVDLRMTRWDCEQWLRRNGYPIPPKSACVFCPYRRRAEWRRLRDEAPEDFQRAIEIDRAIRTPGYGRLVGECYVHDSMVPLELVDLSTAEENGQPNLWDDECEGMCGV